MVSFPYMGLTLVFPRPVSLRRVEFDLNEDFRQQTHALKISPIFFSHLFSQQFFIYSYYILGKWYFDTVFSLTSVWHSDVACAVPADNERENAVVFGIPPLKHMCVFQNYKQRTTYLNWANHLVFSPLRHVCVPKLHTENHLFELS